MTTSSKWAWDPRKKAEEFGIDPDFVEAIVHVESAGNPLVVRFEPGWKYFLTPQKWATKHHITIETEKVLQAMSWGPMQIMGTKLRELGFDGMLTEAIDPTISAHFSCKLLRVLFDRWHSDLETIAAAYNAGSPMRDPATKLFRNQEYVCKVMSEYNKGGS